MKNFGELKPTTPVITIAAAVLIEAFLLLLLVLFYIKETINRSMFSLVGAGSLIIFLLSLVAILLWAGHNFFWNKKKWTRGVIFTWQIFQISIAFPAIKSEYFFLALFAITIAIIVMFLFMSPHIRNKWLLNR